MAANLRLVLIEPVQKTPFDKGVQSIIPKRSGRECASMRTKPSVCLVLLVVTAHALAIIWIVGSRLEQDPVKVVQVPMMVSLLKSQEPATETDVQEPVPTKAVVKKQKQPTKEKLPVTEAPAKEAPVQENQIKEQPQPHVAEAAPAAEQKNVVKSVEAARDTETKQVEAEPEVEPPKFGAAYLNNPAPEYPQMAKRKGEQGRVLLKVLVSESGQPEKVLIDTSSGYSKLDQAALEAVRKWSFIPASRSNQPVSAYVLVPIKFSLNS